MKKAETPSKHASDPLLTAEEEAVLDDLLLAASSMAESATSARIEAEAVLQTLRQINKNS